MTSLTYLTWINPLGGFDYWPFISQQDYNVEIEDSGTTNKNIFPNWPKSYSAEADTIKKQTFRRSRESVLVRSQNLTRSQVRQLKYLKTSPLVQMLTDQKSRIIVLVDTASFVLYKDADKLHTLSFVIQFTNNVATQHI
jgi:hypothetical protein